MGDTCEATHSISTKWLKKNGYLAPGQWRYGGIRWSRSGQDSGNVNFEVDTNPGDTHIRFLYTQTDRWSGEKADLDYKIRLEAVPCRYGGIRYWFCCPLSRNDSYCGRRVGTLYIAGKYFGCRKCHRLLYERQTKQKSTGRFGMLYTYFDLSMGLEEGERKIRVKYWKGQPTKRYARYLRKMYAGVETLKRIDSVFRNDGV